jgi:hypothetical protein
MQFQSFTSLAALLSVASAYINSNQLNLWTDSACSVPDKEITLTATGCACNNIASPGAFSVSAAVTDANCTPESTLSSFLSSLYPLLSLIPRWLFLRWD